MKGAGTREARAFRAVMMHADVAPVPVQTLMRYVDVGRPLAWRAIKQAMAERLLAPAVAERGSKRLPGVVLTPAGRMFVAALDGDASNGKALAKGKR